MSDRSRKRGDEAAEADAEEHSGGTLPPNPELEDALRAAVESVEGGTRPPANGVEEPAAAAEEPAPEAEAAPVGEAPEPTPEELAAELSRTRDRLLRLQADFENFRRRSLAERHDIYRYGHENLVKDLLSTVDNLDRAIGHARESGGGDLESFLQGVELVRRELLAAFANHSICEVEALGKAFDPAVHEAMAQVADGSVAPNTVIEVLQKGYRIHDRLLRPAGVVVAKAPEPESRDGAESEDGGEAAD